ncbi:MAG: TonB-dependent receptor plug domain-containing protein, partial [Pseudomonadota bacterium]
MVFQTTRIATSAFLRATLLGSTFIVSSASLMATAAAQNVETGVVSGKVTDAVSGINLQGVLVRIPSLNLRESTDREGTFRFGRVPVGTHEVIITYQNRQSETRTVTVTSNQTEVITLALQDLGATDDEIIVRGTRPIADSEAAAYSRQKSSDKLINVVAADTIGRFPDQNVAAALSRLPGISVERDQGQERYVNLRGAPNKWTTISFNGLNVVSPEGRASRFDTIPNAIVSSIEATKAVTADMPAESIAGNINIITRNPFDRPGLHTSGEAALGFLQLGGGEQSNLAGTISNTFADDTMGFLISGTFYRRNQVTDNIENRFEFAGEADGTPGEDLIWSRGTDIRVYNLVRANKGLTGRFDWRPNENHELFVSSIFTEFTDDENRDQYIFDYDSDAPNGCYAQVEAPCNNTPTAGIVYGVDIDATFNTNNYRENIFTNTIGGDHFVSGWDLGWRLNATHTEDEFFAPARYLFNAPGDVTERPSVAYDYTDPDFPETLLFDTIDNGNGTYSLGERRFDISSNDLGLTQIER